MKRTAFITAAAIALALTACVREEIFPVSTEYGAPVNATLTLGMSSIPEVVVTKAASGNAYSALNSLLLVFFDTSGNFKTTLNTASGDVTLGDTSSETSTGVQYTAGFTIESGTYNVVGIGNFTGVTNWTGDADGETTFSAYLSTLLTSLANGDLSYSDFLDKIFYISYSSYVSKGLTPTFDTDAVLLTGCNQITVTESGGSATGELELYRGIANIEFNVTQTYTKTITVESDGTTSDGDSTSDGSTSDGDTSTTADDETADDSSDSSDDTDTGTTTTTTTHTVTFVPSSYAVYNVPKGIKIDPSLDKTDGAYSTSADDYYDTGSNIIGTVTDGTYTFNFFMPENIQADADTTDTAYTGYATREAWDWTTTAEGEKKDWLYAPDNATYVVISGTYTETDANGTLVYRGTVSYTVHLGDFSTKTDASGNPYKNYADYTVKRNCSYIYTITVRGVNDIIAEATTTADNSPGAEGSIYEINDDSYYYVLDSHYEQVILSYNLTKIADAATATMNANEVNATDKAIGENIILIIESPFQSGTKTIYPYKEYCDAVSAGTSTATAKTAALNGVDYEWLEFWPQSTNNTIAAYPGTSSAYLMDAYDVCVALGKAVKVLMTDGSLTTTTETNATTGECNDSNYDNIVINTGISSDGSETTTYRAYFTGFVNEYYYTTNPINGNSITWGDFVNKDSRRMTLSMNSSVSSDDNSAYSTVRTRVVQRSIQTFYDSEDASTLNGFGLETYNESGRATSFGTDNYSDNGSNGLLNFTSAFDRLNTGYTLSAGTTLWSKYIGTTDSDGNVVWPGWTSSVTAGNGDSSREMPAKLYQDGTSFDAWYACLSRNRDLNGDGTIDKNEVVWYLPTVEEYTLVMLGENALSNESRLYFGDKTAMTSSSYPDSYLQYGALYYSFSPAAKRVFWAVERASYAAEGTSYDATATDFEGLPLRCARRLPALNNGTGGLSDYDHTIDELCTIKLTSDGNNYVADLRNTFESSIYRTARITSGALTQHNEDDTENKLYYGFVVPKYDATHEAVVDLTNNYYDLGSGYITATLGEIAFSDDNVCGDYYELDDESDKGAWRVPNLSELVIISQNNTYLNPSITATFRDTTDDDDTGDEDTINIGVATDDNGSTYLNLACRTQFSNQKVRLGYQYYNSKIVCIGHEDLDDSTAEWNNGVWDEDADAWEDTFTVEEYYKTRIYYTTRCVRDATEDELNSATAVSTTTTTSQ